MSLSGIFARLVALIGAAMILLRRMDGAPREQAVGSAPAIPAAKPQGALPTLKMPTARGWPPGQTPIAAPGLKVNAFAAGLKHPRWIHVLPNGDVLVAESLTVAGPIKSVFDYAMVSTMRRAAAARRQPEPHHAAARRGRRRRRRNPRGVPGGAEPAVRHGAGGRYVLCRQYRRRGRLPLCGGRAPHRGAGAQAGRVQARRPLDAQPAAEPRRLEALRRRRLAHQYRRRRHGGRGGPRGDLRTRSRDRREPHLRRRPAQPGGPRLGAAYRRAVDGGQRTRRPRRRDAARTI